MTNFKLSKFKEIAADSLKFDENGRKFSRQVRKRCGKSSHDRLKNAVEKDFARYE